MSICSHGETHTSEYQAQVPDVDVLEGSTSMVTNNARATVLAAAGSNCGLLVSAEMAERGQLATIAIAKIRSPLLASDAGQRNDGNQNASELEHGAQTVCAIARPSMLSVHRPRSGERAANPGRPSASMRQPVQRHAQVIRKGVDVGGRPERGEGQSKHRDPAAKRAHRWSQLTS